MSVESDHPCFIAPEDKNIKIWRYMDFTKFVSLLEEKCLFLSRVDKFEDPYEGAMSHVNSRIEPSVWENKTPREKFNHMDMSRQMSRHRQMTRQWTYVNCWHMNNTESAAMWKLYAQTNESVAIQSTYSRLHQTLQSEAYIGMVNYIDYEKDWLPEGNGFWPYVHKRLSFEHEKELRVLHQDLPVNEEMNRFDHDRVNNEFGKSIPIDLSVLIENVYVSPTAPHWFYNLVANVSKKYGFEFDVKQSELSKTPVF